MPYSLVYHISTSSVCSDFEKIDSGVCVKPNRERTTGETVSSCEKRCRSKSSWCKYFYHVSLTTGDGACNLYGDDAKDCKSDGNNAWTKYRLKPCGKGIYFYAALVFFRRGGHLNFFFGF